MTPTRIRIARRLVPALAVGSAIAAAWWFTRESAGATVVEADEHAGHGGGIVGPVGAAHAVTLTAEAARRIGVTYARAERSAFADEVRVVGVVSYDQTRVKSISPKVDGWVEELTIAFEGQAVDEGAPLLRVYSPMVVTAQEELLLAKRLAAEVASSGDAARRADTLVAAARRKLRYWDIPEDEIARIEQTAQVARTVLLRSPVRGVVVRLGVRAGQRFMAGDVLYELAVLNEVWLEGEVFERDAASIRIGQSVTAEFAALPGGARRGNVVFVEPTLNADTRTLRVRVTFPNPGLTLKPGMFATLRIRSAARTVVHVPRSAVLATGERTLVFVLDSMGMLVPRDVVIGQATSDRVEIVRGVTAGDTVVASATFLIDAESNLGAAVAAMAGMPGMPDMPGTPNAPPKR